MSIYLPTDANIQKAVALLKQGELVSFSTETVYGLGADACNEAAVQKIFKLKGRPSNNPLICHVASIDAAKEIAQVSPKALDIMHQFWPGPVSLVLPLKKKANIAKSVTAGLDTVAVRMPNASLALKLLGAFEHPIAAPSANLSTQISSTTPLHVEKYFKDLFILADGHCKGGLESTILDLSTDHPRILREGLVSAETLSYILNMKVEGPRENKVLKAPGMLALHYSPKLPIRLDAIAPEEGEAFITFGPIIGNYNHVYHLSPHSDLQEAAHHLYDALHQMDQPGKFKGIAVMPIPKKGIGLAINDRLKRAKKTK